MHFACNEGKDILLCILTCTNRCYVEKRMDSNIERLLCISGGGGGKSYIQLINYQSITLGGQNDKGNKVRRSSLLYVF